MPNRIIMVGRGWFFYGYNFNYFIRMGSNDLFDGPVPFDKKCSGFKVVPFFVGLLIFVPISKGFKGY